MILTLIWERYILMQAVRVFLLFLFSFYGLYIIIDYSSHAGSFHHNHIQFKWIEVALYYAAEFSRKVEILAPFALLVATIKTLTGLNLHNELVAMLAHGIPLKRLLRPFLLFGLAWTLLLYINNEFFLPAALQSIKRINDVHSSQKLKNNGVSAVQHLVLEDKSTLLFQNYDTARRLFFDAYWIRSIDDIYRIKYLFPYEDIPTGHFVDHLVRSQHGEMIGKESYSIKTFPEMKFNKQILMETIIPPDHLSLSQLWVKKQQADNELNEKQAQAQAAFFYKITMPWFCFLVVLGAAPWCVRFSRHQNVFMIYACLIFGLVACYLVMDAALVLGERQVFTPEQAIVLPFCLIASIITLKYWFTR